MNLHPGNNGKGKARTPIQVTRQIKVYGLALEGYSYREIQAETGLSLTTITEDMKAEGIVRSAIIASDRNDAIAKSVATYERIYRQAGRRREFYERIMLAAQGVGLDEPGDMDADPRVTARRKRDAMKAAQAVKIIDETFAIQVKCRERIDKILGIEKNDSLDAGVAALVAKISEGFDAPRGKDGLAPKGPVATPA